MYLTAREGGAKSHGFTCPKCNASDAIFRHEHLLPDNFWSYNDTAYQGVGIFLYMYVCISFYAMYVYM